MTRTGRIISICMIAVATALAQPADIEQLKAKLLQLEQLTLELKGQLTALNMHRSRRER